MGQIYIVADFKLKESSIRDQELIKNWNRIVQEDDEVLLFGTITDSKEASSIKEIFDQLKGKKRIMDMDYSNKEDVNRFKYITGTFPYHLGCFVPGSIKNQNIDVYLPINAEQLSLYKEEGKYCAAGASLLKQEEIYENKCLDISIEKWGDIPILYTDIPVLINNMLSFEEEIK